MLARACANMTAAERRAAEAYVAAFWAQVVVQAVVKAVVKAVVRMQPTKSGALLTRMCLLGPGS
jgi:HEPN domain-containing protein